MARKPDDLDYHWLLVEIIETNSWEAHERNTLDPNICGGHRIKPVKPVMYDGLWTGDFTDLAGHPYKPPDGIGISSRLVRDDDNGIPGSGRISRYIQDQNGKSVPSKGVSDYGGK